MRKLKSLVPAPLLLCIASFCLAAACLADRGGPSPTPVCSAAGNCGTSIDCTKNTGSNTTVSCGTGTLTIPDGWFYGVVPGQKTVCSTATNCTNNKVVVCSTVYLSIDSCYAGVSTVECKTGDGCNPFIP